VESNISHPKYRPDIDGLRALAVIPVVLFHVFPELITGGYVGVDIFFVISGYLISLIILKNFNSNTFSFVDFYVRRIRRIFPTLTTVLVFSLVFGWFALLPDEYAQLGKHVAGSSVFISNFVLLSESGYFDSASISKPLLHLWSLAVEEQFYIVWPLLLVFFRKFINPIFIALALLMLTFAANIHFIDQNQSLTFYSPVMRFWEILCGSCLAWCQVNKQYITAKFHGKVPGIVSLFITSDGRSPYRHLISIAGLCLIAIAMYRYTEALAFPGWYAVAPVIGAVMLILAGPHAFVNKFILSRKLVIWFGLISYPLYLWHWPLLSFAHIMDSGYPSYKVRSVIVVLSIFMAWFSYRYIEKNLRSGGYRVGKTLSLIAVMVLIGATGMYINLHNGIENRFSANSSKFNDEKYVQNAIATASERCVSKFSDWSKFTDKGNSCLMQKPMGQNEIALVGDSHARHLFIGMSELYSARGVSVFPASCAAPFINVSSSTQDKHAGNMRKDAYKLINEAYDYIAHNPRITDVILAHNPSCSASDAIDIENPSNKNNQDVLDSGLRRTLDVLVKAHKRITIVFDNPGLMFDPKVCVVRPLRISSTGGGRCTYDRSTYDQSFAHQSYKNVVKKVLKDYPGVMVVDLSDKFCNASQCTLARDGHLLYQDMSHLTPYGSRYVAPFILK
jgi:peptidoglycan/LPS O-acetylase OafA/YrhL